MKKALLSLTCVMAIAPEALAHDKTMVILGDSVATGAVSSENVDARFRVLLWNFFTYGVFAPKQTEGGVNFPANAFTLIASTGFGVKPENVFNFAKNGERVDSIATQFERLAEKTSKVPDYFILSFTANDACHEEIFDKPVADFRAHYLKNLLEGANGRGGMRALVRAAPAQRETSIYLLASLNFNQVLTSSEILARNVPLHFSTVQCSRFREGAVESAPRISYLANKLKGMCPAILKTNPHSNDEVSIHRRQHLRDVHSAMVSAQAEAAEVLRRESTNPGVKISFIEAPANISFAGKHVANDCFHLSREGQGYLGIKAWEEIFDRGI